jgi:hypothetical protein
MARIFTTPDAVNTAKVLMHHITVAGGINTKNLLTRSQWPISDSRFVRHAQVICNELVNRDFANIDQSIIAVANFRFKPNYDDLGKYKSMRTEAVAKAIVYFAECVGLYWDDTVRTPYEIAEFKKTLLGDAVYKYGRYISAIPDKATKRSSTASSANTQKVASAAPQNSYKQSGPQSGNARDLRDLNGNPGIAGEKVFAVGDVSYKIVADKVGKNTPNVFIKPLLPSGEVNGTNKIFISSGNGYTDCTCYFDDPNDAQDFLDKIIAAGRVPAGINNIHVAKTKSDSNGYFLIGTEFGICAISARTLNEAMVEALKEDSDRGNCWEKATENYTREELEELHTWMRRD